MQVSNAGFVNPENVTLETFVGFCEFTYTGDYKNPAQRLTEHDADVDDVTRAAHTGLESENLRQMK